MRYEQTVKEHLRITILRLLSEDSGYTLNESIITDLAPLYGLRPSRDNVRTELAWLKGQGLVAFDNSTGIIIAVLTREGIDVALGRSTVPGVKRPSPGA